MPEVDVRLNVIVDAGAAARAALPALARLAAEGGATLIQYRDKEGDDALLIETARAIAAALSGSGVPLVINDRADISKPSGAFGVHLGQDDMTPIDARALLGPAALVGRTIKNLEHARAVAAEPVDYACIGGVFATASKVNPDPPIGIAGFQALRAEIARLRPGLPVSAIAGITRENAADLIRAGADGIAVVSAVIGAADPRAAARELRRTVDGALARRKS